jgi:hypothetical protein
MCLARPGQTKTVSGPRYAFDVARPGASHSHGRGRRLAIGRRMLLAAVITGIAAIAAAAIPAWAALRARKKQDGVIDLVGVSVTEAEALLAEPGVDTNVLSEIVPDHPVFDIAVCNNGDRTAFARRIHLQLKEPINVPALDPPCVFRSEHAITSRGRIVAWRRGPSDGYAINFPLQEGSYARTINQAVGAGDVDRFVVSLVAREAERGKDFCQVSISLDYGRTRKGRRQAMSEPIWVLAYGPPSWESPDVIKERLSQLADRVRELAPEDAENVGVRFNSVIFPIRTGMEDYVAVYETKLQILATLLGKCLRHATDETRIRGWLAELDSALSDVTGLLRHAANLRASGRHP